MIIMRALVATVLLITVVLVSIVLINANSREERSGETTSGTNNDSKVEVDKADVEVLFEGSFEGSDRMGLNPEEERKALELEETVRSNNGSSLINAIKKVTEVVESDYLEISNSSRDAPEGQEKLVKEDDEEEQIVILRETSSIEPGDIYEEVNSTAEEVPTTTTEKLTTENIYRVDDTRVEDQRPNEEPEDKYLESKTLNDIKTRSKENQWAGRNPSQTTERQTPLGYEPESYIVLDAEPTVSDRISFDEKKSKDDDLDPTSDISSRPLERKQRAVIGSPETIVLNRAPIVPHMGTYKDSGYPHMFHKSSALRYAKAFDRTRPGYPGLPSIYEPNHWESRHHTNMLRFPQCSGCEQKHCPLCVSCGRCSECCRQSGCTCGCLNSQ